MSNRPKKFKSIKKFDPIRFDYDQRKQWRNFFGISDSDISYDEYKKIREAEIRNAQMNFDIDISRVITKLK